MDFSKRKLPKEASGSLRKYSVDTLRPLALMVSPVYVYLRRNEKFIGIKCPLDFFTAQEIEKVRPYGMIFVPLFVDRVLPFAQAGRHVRALLSWQPHHKDAVPPTPFELSDAVLRVVGPLWGSGPLGAPIIEPFFVTVFVNELCEALPGDLMLKARETDVDGYEMGIFRSSWAVFLALHLGFCDREFLNHLRLTAFMDTVQGSGSRPIYSEVDQIIALARETSGGSNIIKLNGDNFGKRFDRISQKVANRLERVKREMLDSHNPVPTIFGAGGFVDA